MLTIVYYMEELKRDVDMNYSFMHPKKVYEHFQINYSRLLSENYVIATMHRDILNIIGQMIEDDLLRPSDIKCILTTKNGDEVEFGYDDEGYLDDKYDYGYFNWD